MGKTKTTPGVGSSTALRRVFPPCPAATNVGKTANITLFDPKKLINSNSNLKNALVDVENFYSNLKNTTGLDTAVSSDLSAYTFQATYKPAAPSAVEINAMGRMDFPMYVFNSPGLSSNLSSVSEMHQLMETHQIPSILFLTTYTSPNSAATNPTGDVYETISKKWSDTSTLGFGFPAIYHTSGSCHKLGLIKIDAVLNNVSGTAAVNKFKFVVKHELGHMFAVSHEAGTIMNEEYNLSSSNFKPLQINVIRDTLKNLSP
ncbi:MAG: hypothetical protein KJN76_00665 [Eudoraea sp.]|nr:hypothetical protein [Eudoraea sp.]